jgi:hypothetical protein
MLLAAAERLTGFASTHVYTSGSVRQGAAHLQDGPKPTG